ncbi:hypothetical protein DFP93_101307 [Aneurinibacillus soli]|uniref:Uncharacterized protein n=1 Tax=Aneurinibacillus soli TaxID=1500254 RepID=A0A0U5B9G7_9BACL|nr:hypothetical protein DFP93_101307 [Aneurinibacillus soli]BAU28230.1 hypothetical protein CB4_02404 [Aneurinibacillus soli]
MNCKGRGYQVTGEEELDEGVSRAGALRRLLTCEKSFDV